MQTQQYPPLPERVTARILRHLTVIELMILCERFGPRAIAARMGVDLETAITAAGRGQKSQ